MAMRGGVMMGGPGLAELFGGGDREPEQRPLHDAQIHELKEFNKIYQNWLENGTSFKPGDIITPMPGRSTKNSGEPHVVLEVRAKEDRAQVWSAAEGGSTQFGMRPDIRLAVLMSDNYVAFWVEAYEYILYDPAVHGVDK